MARHFKLDQTLTPEDLAALRAFALVPGKTIDQCCDWLEAHGYVLHRPGQTSNGQTSSGQAAASADVIHRSAVGTWVAAQRATDRFSSSRQLAEAMTEAARGGGVLALTDASLVTLSEQLLAKLMALQAEEVVKTEDLVNISNALRRVVDAKSLLEEFRKQQAEAVAQAERLAKGGGSATSVVDAIKRALGLEAGGDEGGAA